MPEDNSPDIRIDPIAEPYIEGFWKTLDAVARERRYLLFVEAPPFESTVKFLTTNIEKNHAQFVALDGKQVIGWCDVLPTQFKGMEHVGRLGIGLLEAYRGKGIGYRLMHKTMQAAAERGLSRIELEVLASNTTAQGLYRKLGFVEEGRKHKARCLDGVWDDFVLMARIREAPISKKD